MPWKNGGGITHEALREPSGGEPYLWRLSVAEIGVSGPFSSFAGYHRTMALLAGDGVQLNFADGAQSALTRVGDIVLFDGATPPDCRLIAGPCADLNLIVSNSIARPRVSVEDLQVPRFITVDHCKTILLFAVRGSFLVAHVGPPASLSQWDVAMLAPGDEVTLTPVPGDFEVPLMFTAYLDDNRSQASR